MSRLQKKIIAGIIISIVLLFVFAAIFVSDDYFVGEVVVAACPSFHYIIDTIEGTDNVVAIKTKNTFETIDMVEQGLVDFGIARRVHLDGQEVSSHIVGSGYDFISSEGLLIKEPYMKDFLYYTDIDKDQILQDFRYIKEENIAVVDNPIDYLEKGIVITILEREMSPEIQTVHVIKNSGERLRMSTLPIMYYLPDAEEAKVNFANNLLASIYNP